MANQVFISYRRDGGDTTAKLICETLKNRGYTVFYDHDALKGGFFDTRILQAIDECKDFVLVLPPDALARCVNEDDWVRQEVRHAIKAGKNIIPIMLNGFEFPSTLPSDIEEVSRYNGIRFMMDYYDAVIDKIVDRLSEKSSEKIPENPSSFNDFVGMARIKRPFSLWDCLFIWGLNVFGFFVWISVFVDGIKREKLFMWKKNKVRLTEGAHLFEFRFLWAKKSATVNISPQHAEVHIRVRFTWKLLSKDFIKLEVFNLEQK